MLEYQNVKISLQKITFQIGLKKCLLYRVPWIYVIRDLNGEQIVGLFYEKELQKTKKVIKRQTILMIVKKFNKKVTSYKTKHVETEKKLNDLTNEFAQVSEKGYVLLLAKYILQVMVDNA